jgi:hypothetical protein
VSSSNLYGTYKNGLLPDCRLTTTSTSPPGGAIGGIFKVDSNSTITPASSSGAVVTRAASSIAALFITGAVLFAYLAFV